MELEVGMSCPSQVDHGRAEIDSDASGGVESGEQLPDTATEFEDALAVGHVEAVIRTQELVIAPLDFAGAEVGALVVEDSALGKLFHTARGHELARQTTQRHHGICRRKRLMGSMLRPGRCSRPLCLAHRNGLGSRPGANSLTRYSWVGDGRGQARRGHPAKPRE